MGLNSVTGWNSHTDECEFGVLVTATLTSATAPQIAKNGRTFILNTPYTRLKINLIIIKSRLLTS
ncbi:hypothetical protein ALT1545_230046 [Alteromonas macleodii]